MLQNLQLRKNKLLFASKFIFKEFKLNSFLISNLSNIRYLTNFTGGAGFLLIIKNKYYLLTDGRYTLQAKKEVDNNIEVITYKVDIFKELTNILKKDKISVMGIEESDIKYNQIKNIKKYIKIKSVDISNVILQIRSVKEKKEITYIKKALNIAENSLKELKVIPGKTEKEIAAELEYIMKKNNADDISFPTIVAAGKNSALPHYQPGNRRIRKNDIVLIDFGAVYKGYHSDTTRVIFLGDINKKIRKMFSVVNNALNLGMKLAAAGTYAEDIDKKINDYIIENGYKNGLIHSIGHGVGLDIHEYPILNRNKHTILENGMVFTIEPGIYIENIGGIRLENMICIEKNKPKNLNKLPIYLNFH